MTRRPEFLVIGAMKCMTSTLHEQLVLQPGVCMSQPKEPCFFSDDHQYKKGMRWYQSCWQHPKPGDILGESSTHYTKLPQYPRTVERIARDCPDVKLIYVMRHPVDRLVSHYVHLWSTGNVKGSIDSAINKRSDLIDFGRYAYQLTPYLHTFGDDRVLPVFLDRLRKKPQQELERIGRFLGCEFPLVWHPDLRQQNMGCDRMRKNAARDVIVNAPGLAWIRKRFVPQRFRDGVKSYWQMRSRPTLSDESQRRLQEIFDADLERLSEQLELPFTLSCNTFSRIGDYDFEAAPSRVSLA